jgi:1-acyl-sn-glycerol-3-phosphate acyltransferase
MAAVKFILFFLLISFLLIHHSLVSLVIPFRSLRLRYFLKSIQRTSKVALKILNVKVHYHGDELRPFKGLQVSNHLSYVDVLILFSYHPSLFVTSVEIKETFLLGKLCELAGCFFVERRRSKHGPETKNQELKQMNEKISEGFSIFLFPEGTSSDGQGVLPFKGTFFQLAVDAGIPVRPFCLRYLGENKDTVPWYGKMTFAKHLFALCRQKEIQAELSVLPYISGFQKMEFASHAHKLILEKYATN